MRTEIHRSDWVALRIAPQRDSRRPTVHWLRRSAPVIDRESPIRGLPMTVPCDPPTAASSRGPRRVNGCPRAMEHCRIRRDNEDSSAEPRALIGCCSIRVTADYAGGPTGLCRPAFSSTRIGLLTNWNRSGVPLLALRKGLFRTVCDQTIVPRRNRDYGLAILPVVVFHTGWWRYISRTAPLSFGKQVAVRRLCTYTRRLHRKNARKKEHDQCHHHGCLDPASTHCVSSLILERWFSLCTRRVDI